MDLDKTIGGIILIILGGIGWMIKRAIGKNDADKDRDVKLHARVAKLEIQHDGIKEQLRRIEGSLDKIIDLLLKEDKED